MGRYRKIDTRMWADSRFRELSSPDPSGKYLWIFLLTGPQTGNIPGLFRGGEMALAEELEWTPEGFRKAFAELFAKGLVKADWKARIVWVPNAIKYNAPENPNVVKHWRTAWGEIPECSLKHEAYERLKVFTEGLGEGFGKAFTEGCAKGLANQEQEQEQEQDKNSSSELESSSDPAACVPERKSRKEPPKEAWKLAQLLKAEIRRNKSDYRITPAQERQWAATADRMIRLDGRTPEKIAELIRWAQCDEFWAGNVLSMEKLREKFDQLSLKAQLRSRSAEKHAPVKLPPDYVPTSERIPTEAAVAICHKQHWAGRDMVEALRVAIEGYGQKHNRTDYLVCAEELAECWERHRTANAKHKHLIGTVKTFFEQAKWTNTGPAKVPMVNAGDLIREQIREEQEKCREEQERAQ